MSNINYNYNNNNNNPNIDNAKEVLIKNLKSKKITQRYSHLASVAKNKISHLGIFFNNTRMQMRRSRQFIILR